MCDTKTSQNNCNYSMLLQKNPEGHLLFVGVAVCLFGTTLFLWTVQR